MRFSCEVLIVNRLIPSCGVRGYNKPVRATVAIGRKACSTVDRNGDGISTVFILVCTAKERNGVKYKVKGNVQQIFAKFLDNGKATIRMKEPPHDLCISKANPTSLKTFLSVLNLGEKELSKTKLSSLAPAKASEVEKLKTEMTIVRRGDYPLGKPFPQSLRRLAVHSCGMLRVDPKIVLLTSLTSLNLSNNQIKELPSSLNKLTSLAELVVSGNKLGEFPSELCHGNISTTLKFLDLSNNNIALLPRSFCKLSNLVHLKLDGAGLHMLPVNIGHLIHLQYISASNNQLQVLPVSLMKLRLQSVDFSSNPFLEEKDWAIVSKLRVPSLMELAGRVVKKFRCKYNEKLIPRILCRYLDNAKKCQYGNHYCFNSLTYCIVAVNVHHMASTVVSQSPTQRVLPAESFLCSWKCLQQWQKDKQRVRR